MYPASSPSEVHLYIKDYVSRSFEPPRRSLLTYFKVFECNVKIIPFSGFVTNQLNDSSGVKGPFSNLNYTHKRIRMIILYQ